MKLGAHIYIDSLEQNAAETLQAGRRLLSDPVANYERSVGFPVVAKPHPAKRRFELVHLIGRGDRASYLKADFTGISGLVPDCRSLRCNA